MRHHLLIIITAMLAVCSSALPNRMSAQSPTPSLHQGQSFLLPYFILPSIPNNTFYAGSGLTSWRSPTATVLSGSLPRFTNRAGNSIPFVPNDEQVPQIYLLENIFGPIFPPSDRIVPNAALGLGFNRPSEVLYDVGAYQILPESALGREYFVMAYNGDFTPNVRPLIPSNLPSYVVVLATQDSTEVLIAPRFASASLGNKQRTVFLRRNEAYTVQSEPSLANQFPDLTGTRISSNKPIAVYGGTQGGNVPMREVQSFPGFFRTSLLMSEQQPPVSTWGKDAMLVPLIAPTQEFITELEADIKRNSILRSSRVSCGTLPRFAQPRVNLQQYARILAAYNNTEVFRVGALGNERIAVLQAGDFVEITFGTATLIRASQPILVAQWMNEQDVSLSTAMLIRPTSQYAAVHTVATITISDDNSEPMPIGSSIRIDTNCGVMNQISAPG